MHIADSLKTRRRMRWILRPRRSSWSRRQTSAMVSFYPSKQCSGRYGFHGKQRAVRATGLAMQYDAGISSAWLDGLTPWSGSPRRRLEERCLIL